MSTRTIDLACLDMAGTTIDEGGLVYVVLESTVAEAAGRDVPPELLARWKGTSKHGAIEGLLEGLGAPHDEAAVDAVFAAFRARLIATYRSSPPAPIPGVMELLADLRSDGVRVALQTGYSRDIASAILDGLGWTVGPGPADTVDAIVTSDEVAASRPAPYLIFHCMEATGVVDVRRVLVAGDTPNDVLAGHRAGAGVVVGVLTGSFDAQALSDDPGTQVLRSLADAAELTVRGGTLVQA
ncbi:phosphonatase-like hydrolase [Aeromicrobium chenweiae]|uniref:Phosphonatase-like hydrolase n=1 Tax=Aeromicrobium chenweiae TaxID=2079793 RepID=A0A2S0WP33_9ACTN|nr:phosphonatase-like hydrolase [Aeromicrobium chenweiae]AWB93062.1 phosphonatase-like hydrolase [Aeromicrobium chenweiae]TGN34051.1 phosphonatase-like hydrolase [Aeromicrobium chenweiae]